MQEATPGPLRKAHDPDGADPPTADRLASPPLPVSQHQCRIPLMADLAAAAAARSVVEDAIRAWRVPVDAGRGSPAHQRTGDQRRHARHPNRGNVRASHDRLRHGRACEWMSMTGPATSRCWTLA